MRNNFVTKLSCCKGREFKLWNRFLIAWSETIGSVWGLWGFFERGWGGGVCPGMVRCQGRCVLNRVLKWGGVLLVQRLRFHHGGGQTMILLAPAWVQELEDRPRFEVSGCSLEPEVARFLKAGKYSDTRFWKHPHRVSLHQHFHQCSKWKDFPKKHQRYYGPELPSCGWRKEVVNSVS